MASYPDVRHKDTEEGRKRAEKLPVHAQVTPRLSLGLTEILSKHG
jgi:hypothetical protein